MDYNYITLLTILFKLYLTYNITAYQHQNLNIKHLIMIAKQKNSKGKRLSKSLSKSKLNNKISHNCSMNEHSFPSQIFHNNKSKSLYLKNKNNNSCFISKNWNQQSTIQNAQIYRTNPSKAREQINTTQLINRFRSLEQQTPLISVNPLKQKILAQEMRRSIQHKNMQISKLLAELHHFLLSISDVKWILQTSYNLMVSYNTKIQNFYMEYFKVYCRKDQIQNIAIEAKQLLNKFNELESIGIKGNKYNALKMTQDLKKHQLLLQNEKKSNKQLICNQKTENSSSHYVPQDKESLQKFLQDLKRQNCYKNNFAQDFKTKTFNITENNSPFKNKTLNELIKLSQMRKTSHSKMYNIGEEQKQNFNLLNYAKNEEFHQSTFSKNKKLDQNRFYQVKNKNPFEAIEIDVPSHQKQKIKQLQLLIIQLKQQIEQNKSKFNQDNYNNQILSSLQHKKQELDCVNKYILEENQHLKNQHISYQVYIKKIVDKILNVLKKIKQQNKINSHSISPVLKKSDGFFDTQTSSYRLNSFYFNELLKILQNLTNLNQNVTKLDNSLLTQQQQAIKDSKCKLQKQLIQIQFQISQLRTVKQQLKNTIQAQKSRIYKTELTSKTSQQGQRYEDACRLLFLQAKTIQQILQST